MVDSVAGTFRATYDPDGSVATEKLPGAYTVTQTEDPTGSATARTYTRDADGAVIAGDAVGASVHGQRLEHTGTPGQESEQSYTYDRAGRLTTVLDATDVTCTRRTYGFNARSDRMSQSTVTSAPGASACPTTGAVTTTHTYDSVDRITDAGYGYDALGRTTASPGATTAYYSTDLVQQQTAGTVRTSWTLDAGMRSRGWTTESNASGTWTSTATRLNHYDGSGDEPKWTVESTGTAAVTRNVESLSGDLAATTAASGATSTVLQLTNLHGDVTLQLPLDTAVAPTVLAADEYGNVRTGSSAARYGWLGAKQRSAETPTGMLLMGVRVYNPVTGRFLQTDPVAGGSCNDYDYTCADPVNAYDLDGRWKHWGKWLDRAATGLSVAAMFGCGPCAAASAAISLGRGIYKVRHGDRSGWFDVAGSAFYGSARGLRYSSRLVRSYRMGRAPKGVRGMSKYYKNMRKRAAAQHRRFNHRYTRRADSLDRTYGAANTAFYGYQQYRSIRRNGFRRWL
jgi:RHS repeat-associated protein